MTTYLVPNGFGEAELIEKKSRFIARVWRAEAEEEALEHIKEMREKHRDATHNVYAYNIRENNITRYSDDGEPSGTSGQPTLNVFLSENVQNVCCVVTRYFGGILLGAGGLVRAYSKAAKMALDAAGIARMAEWHRFLIACPYGFYERAKYLLEAAEAVTESTEFAADVRLDVLVRADRADEFERDMADASAGRVLLENAGERFMGVKI